MANLQSPNLLIKEQLYDARGRAAFTTVNVIKKTNANNAFAYTSQLGFAANFIKTRAPTSSGIWEGGAIDGDILNWVDPTSFSTTDASYAYSGIYFEPAPTSRAITTSKPGSTFSKDSDYSTTNYYSELSDDIKNAFNVNLNIATDDMPTHYAIGGSQTFLGDLGKLTSADIKDLAGQPISSIKFASPTDYVITANSSHTGAQLSSDNSLVPIMIDNLTFLPNYYSSIMQSHNYYLDMQSNTLGQMVYRHTPDENATVYFYDIYGRVRFTQNADQRDAGTVLYYLYDILKRLTEIGILKNTWDIQYFKANYQEVITNVPVSSDGKYTGKPLRRFIFDQLPDSGTFDLNSQGRLVQIINWNNQLPDSANISLSQISLTYSYDDLGRIVSVSIDDGNGNVNVVTYAYDSANNITAITYPTGVSVSYTYNAQNQIAIIGYQTTDGSTQNIASYSYNANGLVLTETLGINNKIVRTYSYNNSLGQLTAISDNQALFQENISYTDQDTLSQTGSYQDGNIQYIDCTFNNGTSTQSYKIHYTYDVFNRLINASFPENQSWIYDANGNMATSGDGSIYNLVSGTNRLDSITSQNDSTTGNYQYTSNGLTTQTPDGKIFSYDLLTQLPAQITAVDTSIINLTYDGKGERYQKITSDITLTYIRGLSAWPLVEIITDTAATTTLNYIYGPTGLIMINDQSDTNNNYFVLKDHLGSTRLVYNDDINSIVAYYTYDSFGQLIEDQSGGNDKDKFRYRYSAQEWDAEINLYNYHARQYDPAVGRFLTPDPAHQFASPYIYVGNNPINCLDLDGSVGWQSNHDLAISNLSAILDIATEQDPAYMHGILIMGDYYNKNTNMLFLVGQPRENGPSNWQPGKVTRDRQEWEKAEPNFTGAELPGGERASQMHTSAYHATIAQKVLRDVGVEITSPENVPQGSALGFSIRISPSGNNRYSMEISPGYRNDDAIAGNYSERLGWTSRSLNYRPEMESRTDIYGSRMQWGWGPNSNDYNGRPLPIDQERIREALTHICEHVTQQNQQNRVVQFVVEEK